MLQVGSLAARWVLMQHAEPWLLNVQSKQWSQSHPTSDRLKNQQSSSVTRKRCQPEALQEIEAPPTKSQAADNQEIKEMTSEKLCEEKEGDGEVSGEYLLNLGEEGGETPVERKGKHKPEMEEGKEKKELSAREYSSSQEESCCPPTRPPDVNDE